MAEGYLNHQLKPAANVHKFGGSSLQDVNHILQVVATITDQVKPGDFVVVSANGPVTDWLLDWSNGNDQVKQQLSLYFKSLIKGTLNEPDNLLKLLNEDLDQLAARIAANELNEHLILAYGELWSAQLLSAKLSELQINNTWIDARKFITVDQQNNLANPAQTTHLLNRCIAGFAADTIKVVTGFIAQSEAGEFITLGRNGSDYTATLLAGVIQAAKIYLWTDVDGVYSADPNLITDAIRLPELTIGEAQALSELGSQVLHQKTMGPLLNNSIQMVINTCQSDSNGTDVRTASYPQRPANIKVKTLAHKSNLIFQQLSAVTELQARLLQAQLTADQINHYAYHFDKTRNKLSFYIEHQDCFKAAQLIKERQLTLSEQKTGISLISAVGQNIRQNTQVITKFLNRSAQFVVHEFHYPANDHTLSVLIPDAQATTLLQDLHQTFFDLEPSLPIIVLGYGNIGQQFLNILHQHKQSIEQQVKQTLTVVAVANSRYYQFSQDCLLNQEICLDQANDQGQLFEQLKQYSGKPAVIIDLTASEEVASQYFGFAENSWHIISANKIAAADHQWAEQISQTIEKQQRRWLKNTTVGAALPVQSSIQNMLASGDQIHSVSGVFSGSLSWLFGQYDGEKPFMDWVKQAQKQAYTEPDPREDLSGQDVYRKALILSRELGFHPDRVHFEPVLPEIYLAGGIDDFWQHENDINIHIQNLWQQAQKNNQSLRYLARVSAEELRVELVMVDADHAAAKLNPGDNIFIIESQWYADNPLVIQGPGAGREVTAAGVLTDLIEVLQSD